MPPTASSPLPPGQQLVAPGKWPLVGERLPGSTSGPWFLEISGLVTHPIRMSLHELRGLPRRELVVDIHCVTRWSKLGVRFRGVALAEVLDRAVPLKSARFASFVARSDRGHNTSLPVDVALALDALLAFEVEGQPLAQEHGGPLRLVVPERYFYKSIKWLERIELLATDRLGYWEATSGYHNEADPWREQRYIAGRLSRIEAQRILTERDIRGRDLLGLEAAHLELPGLQAHNAILRDADFRGCQLSGACFDGANLSNAHFDGADLRGASFRGADLEGASFQEADLRSADLRAASMIAASFCHAAEPETTGGARIDGTTQVEARLLEGLTPEQYNYLTRQLNSPARHR